MKKIPAIFFIIYKPPPLVTADDVDHNVGHVELVLYVPDRDNVCSTFIPLCQLLIQVGLTHLCIKIVIDISICDYCEECTISIPLHLKLLSIVYKDQELMQSPDICKM